MANSDKNIVITPYIGNASTDPQIVFSGANANVGAQNITLSVLPTSNGTLSFSGSAGQLLTITNNLTGTIFSVNDVSGIPSIEVLSTGTVKLAQYSGNVLIAGTTTDGVSKLQVTGAANVSSLRIAGYGQVISSTGTWTGPSSGLTGNTGATGAQGNTGATGTQGLTGATGTQGIQGNVGATGTQGLTGATGTQGIQGNVGATGTQGLTGATGTQGIQGNIGATGASGIQGNIGATGLRGTTGFNGATGVQGNVGSTGLNGATGLTGATGASGLTGSTGPQGATGAGATGASGVQGNPGATGATGLTGSTGPSGSATFPLANGTSNINAAVNANITVGVGGTANVAVFATTGEYVTGVISAGGNVFGNNYSAVGVYLNSNTLPGGGSINTPGRNGLMAGPITVATGNTFTVANSTVLVIV
jgi:hypothetical protein